MLQCLAVCYCNCWWNGWRLRLPTCQKSIANSRSTQQVKWFWQRWRSRPPLIFTANLANSQLQNFYFVISLPSKLRSYSQICDCNCHFCDDYSCIYFVHRRVVFYRNSHGSAWELMVCIYIFQIWIAMGNQPDKIERNGENIHCAEDPGSCSIACSNMVWEKHTFVPPQNRKRGGGHKNNCS